MSRDGEGAERDKKTGPAWHPSCLPHLSPSSRSRPRRTPALMIQDTSSNAGKSLLTAALCRILFQDGVRVAPFKSQDLALNSYIARDGGEMGRAQVVQAVPFPRSKSHSSICRTSRNSPTWMRFAWNATWNCGWCKGPRNWAGPTR